MSSPTRFLPAPVDKLLSDFTAQSFPFMWTVKNDGVTVSLNVTWKVADQKQIPVRTIQQKPPSTVKRDRERMATFLKTKEQSGTDTAVQLSPRGISFNAQVSPFTCSVSSKAENLNSLGTSTLFSPISRTSATQISNSKFKECGVGCDIRPKVKDVESICNLRPEVKDATVQTNDIQSLSSYSQTDVTTHNEIAEPSDNYVHICDKIPVQRTKAVFKGRVIGNKTNPRKSSTVRVVDEYGKAQEVAEILSEISAKEPEDDAYKVRCVNGRVARIPVLSTPLDFEEILGWKNA